MIDNPRIAPKMHRRSLAAVLTLAAALALPAAAPAKKATPKAGWKSCSNLVESSRHINLATRIKVRGGSCSDAKIVLKSFATTVPIKPPAVNTRLEPWANRCAYDKKQPAGAKKAGRAAATCTTANGKKSVKAWVMH